MGCVVVYCCRQFAEVVLSGTTRRAGRTKQSQRCGLSHGSRAEWCTSSIFGQSTCSDAVTAVLLWEKKRPSRSRSTAFLPLCGTIYWIGLEERRDEAGWEQDRVARQRRKKKKTKKKGNTTRNCSSDSNGTLYSFCVITTRSPSCNNVYSRGLYNLYMHSS